MEVIKIRLGPRSYPVLVGKGILGRLGKMLGALGCSGRGMIVTNRKVGALYLRPLTRVLRREGIKICYDDSIPMDESAKSEKILFRLYSRMLSEGLDRSSFVIGLGGGVIGDLAGYAAATFMRGIPWVVVPTTLLAQVDSSIGGKTGINLREGKNLVGSFHQPKLVLADVAFLRTLPDSELRNALAEVIKYAMIWDRDFFSYLERHISEATRRNLDILEVIVRRCVGIKKIVVEKDEQEKKDLRSILNYGHTFAHAFEAASGSWRRSLPHGRAVAAGMVAAGELALREGLFGRSDQLRQVHLIREAGLPVGLGGQFTADRILACMQSDKKKQNGRLKFVLPVRIGKVVMRRDIPLSKVRHLIQGFIKT